MKLTGDDARKALGAVRLVNGVGSLLIPRTMVKRFGLDPAANPAALYVLRLFGIRTIVIGADLFRLKGERLADALRIGILIHLSDAVSAVIAGATGQIPRRAATTAAVISSANVAMAIAATLGSDG